MGFTLKQDQRVVWQLPPVPAGQPPLEAVRQRLRMLLGDGVPLLPVDLSAPMPADERDDEFRERCQPVGPPACAFGDSSAPPAWRAEIGRISICS